MPIGLHDPKPGAGRPWGSKDHDYDDVRKALIQATHIISTDVEALWKKSAATRIGPREPLTSEELNRLQLHMKLLCDYDEQIKTAFQEEEGEQANELTQEQLLEEIMKRKAAKEKPNRAVEAEE